MYPQNLIWIHSSPPINRTLYLNNRVLPPPLPHIKLCALHWHHILASHMLPRYYVFNYNKMSKAYLATIQFGTIVNMR